MENITDENYILKDAAEKSDGICLDSVNMGILIPTENDYQANDVMVIEEVKDNQILSDETKIEYKQVSSEVIDDFDMKSENSPSNKNKCDEILPDINLQIDEDSSKMDDTPSIATNIETTPSQNYEIISHLCSQELSSSMILDSTDVEAIQFDGVEMNSFSNVNDLDNADSSMLDEDALLNDESSPMDDKASINEISSQMDEENELLNEDGMDEGNADQIDEDTLLNDEESILNESSSLKIIEILSDNDEDKLLNEGSSSQTDRKSTESEVYLIETDEDTLLNEDSPQITTSQVNENIESSQNSSQIDENIESCQISLQVDENIELSQISLQVDENIESSQISLQIDENIESSQISSQINENIESSQISLQVDENIESSQISLQVDKNIELSQISSQIDENIESSETSSPVDTNESLNAAQSRDVKSLLKDDCMLYIPVAESSQSIAGLLKNDGMLYIPESESLQLNDENLEEKKSKLSMYSKSTPIKISLKNNYVNEHIGGESMDSRESSEEGEIVTGDSLIISGESRFPDGPEIKQEHMEDCEQLTINEQTNFDDCEGNMNSEDMLDTGQKCNEVDGLFIKEECLERIGEESQDCNNIEMEDNTILPQIANCESLQNKQDNAVSSPTDTDIFQTVIKEECLEYDKIETLESNIKVEVTDIDVKEESIDIFDQSIVKQELGYFDDDIQHKEDDLSLNVVNDTDFSVVPVSLKSNSEFHNGNPPNSMEEEIIIPSSVTTNLRPRRCKKFRSKESDAISDKIASEPLLQDMDEEVDDLLAPRGFACPICNKKYMSIVTLTRHEKTHEEIVLKDPTGIVEKNGIYSCTCGKGFRRRSSALACIKVHAKTGLPCQWCALLFQTQMTLRKHCKVAHRDKMRTRHHCTTCKKTFTHKRSLLRHTQLHLRDLKKKLKTKKNKARTVQAIPQQKEIEVINLDSEDSLDKPQLSCDFCSIDYKSVADLRSHLICAHPVIHSASELDLAKRKPFSKFKFNCRTCGKGHSTLGALTLHNKTDHKKVKVTFSCDRCHERFPTRSELSSHRRLHCRGVAVRPPAPPPAPPTPPAPPPTILQHQCDVCGLGFRSQAVMQHHRETHPFLTFARDDNTNTKIFFK